MKLISDRCGKSHVLIVRKRPDSTAHGEQVFQGGGDDVGLWPKMLEDLLRHNQMQPHHLHTYCTPSVS